MIQSGCYTGQVLRVDLTSGRIVSEPLREDWARDFIGGKGLVFRYLYEELRPGTDPLSPANVVVIFPGLLAGTIVATTARTCVGTRSPLTGTILDSYVGGGFAAMLRYAGWDGIIITGQAEKPVYLFIEDERAELRDASPIWGRPIWEAENWLEEQAGPGRIVALTAGPAGENLVPFACLTSEAYRQCGRGGLGAVFGSKRLKSVVVRGSGAVRVPDMAAFLETYRRLMQSSLLTEANLWANAEGTPMIVDPANAAGLFPTRGFTQGEFDGKDGINSAAIQAALVRKRACTNCPLACGRLTKSGRGEILEGPEYETIGLGGGNCGIGNLDDLIAYNRLCDNLGLDTISTGNVIGLAMTMTEEGIHDFGLRYGDAEGYLRTVEDIAYRRGIGEDLSRGARYVARKYGGEDVVLEIKGLEFPAYDPRGAFGMGLAYATSERGACHLRSFVVANESLFSTYYPDSFQGKPQMVINDQNLNSVKWTGIFCDFWAINAEDIATLFSAATGRPFTAEEVMRIGDRIWNVGRLFNLREGFGRKDDYPPPALFKRPLRNGKAAGKVYTMEAYEAALDEYYALRGWTREGVPTPEKLAALGLEW
ncbi:MAG: aldehyde ferredoxin oxidoreductase family protein [Chloroflexia bacterium]